MTVYILTYNTKDMPERRIIEGAYSTYEKANNAFKRLKEILGERVIDWEIDPKEVK